jgi:hypothetical protein
VVVFISSCHHDLFSQAKEPSLNRSTIPQTALSLFKAATLALSYKKITAGTKNLLTP